MANGGNDDLAALLARLSYRKGRFRLASGRESDFYVDVKRTVMTAVGARAVGHALLERMRASDIETVGGMAVGAVPLVTACLAAAAERDVELEGFFVRPVAKDHGTERKIDGLFDPSRRIALVEDVVTTGGSTLAAIDSVEAAGAKVALIVTVVDREEEDGMNRLRERAGRVEALATRSQIVDAASG